MAKTSAIQKNLKRIKLAEKFLKKRTALKKIIKNRELPLADRFAVLAKALGDNEGVINEQLLAAQGEAVDVGGYYSPDPVKVDKAMRPSVILNAAILAL